MAKLTFEYQSEMLARTVTLTAVIPECLTDYKEFPCLYLLHGLTGSHGDWTNQTRIQRWAEEKGIAVIMPSGDNKFYVNNEKSRELYSQFIGDELIRVSRNMFPISHQRDHTYIGGLSMGGYGAVVNGFKYHKTFGTIVGLSSAFILDTIESAQGGIESPLLENRSFFESIFNDLTQVKSSDKDYHALALKIPKNEFPRLYLSCGTEDMFIENNRDFAKFLNHHTLLPLFHFLLRIYIILIAILNNFYHHNI